MIYILWETFDIAVNFYQGFIVVYFAYAYLGDKQQRGFYKSSGCIFGIVIATAISIMNHIIIFEHLYAVLYSLIIFLYCCTCLKGSLLKKIFASVLPNLIMGLSSALIANIAAILFGVDLYSILSVNNIERFISMLAVQLLILYCVTISIRLLKNNEETDDGLVKSEWLLITSVLAISVVIVALLNLSSLNPISHKSKVFTVIVFCGIIMINTVVCYLAVDLEKKNKAVRENEILKVQQEYSKQYVDNVNTEYDVIRKLRHDYKSDCTAIYTLLADGNIEKAMKHIEENVDSLSEAEILINTNDDVVNAVVNSKLSAAKSFGIEVTCLSVKTISGIDDFDLCRLLSNMLENAVTACMSSKRTDRQIYIKISSDECKYVFCIKNTIDESVLEKNPKLKSTKVQVQKHGYGTRIIRDISKKYSGRCDFYEENGKFCCHVILKIN